MVEQIAQEPELGIDIEKLKYASIVFITRCFKIKIVRYMLTCQRQLIYL